MPEFDNNIINIIGYFLTAIVGGVGYKFLSLILTNKTENKKTDVSSDQKLIDNLQKSLEAVTKRVTELEEQREQSHIRELEVTKQLATSQEKVRHLEGKIEKLEQHQENLKKTLNKYHDKYGDIEG